MNANTLTNPISALNNLGQDTLVAAAKQIAAQGIRAAQPLLLQRLAQSRENYMFERARCGIATARPPRQERTTPKAKVAGASPATTSQSGQGTAAGHGPR